MLAYAAEAPKTAGRAGSPKALALILIGHTAVIAAVLTAKPEIIEQVIDKPPLVFNVDPPAPPPPPEPTVKPQTNPTVTQPSFIEHPTPVVNMDATDLSFDHGKALDDITKVIGTEVRLPPINPPLHEVVKVAAVSRTPDSAIKPPYPNDKLRLEQEATLRLRLSIDARGRVTAVDPVGAADPSFLEAARRHIIRAWRYRPATEDGVAVPSSMTVNLSFRLEEV